MKFGLKQLMLSTALAGMLVPAAFAQEGDNPFLRGRHTEVTQRAQPEFNPEPARAGGFDVWADIGASAAYNNNIFAEPNNQDDDTIVRVTPSVEARSNWSVHALNAGVSLDHKEFTSNDSETATDYAAFMNGRIDVQRDFQVHLGADTAHVTEARWEAASFGTAEPASYDTMSAFVRAQYRRDRFQLEGTYGVSTDEFDQLNQQIRDNSTDYFDIRASYAVSPDVAVFIQARESDLDYDQAARDGTRTTIDAGVNFELAAPFAGEIAIGSFKEEKTSAFFGDVDGLNVRANVQWFPTQLTTITFMANRGIVDPGLAASATSVNTAFSVRADHELFRNLLLYGYIRTDNNEFQGTAFDREDDALSGAVGAAWKLNKNVHFEFDWSSRTQDSSGVNAGPDLDVNILSAGVRFYP